MLSASQRNQTEFSPLPSAAPSPGYCTRSVCAQTNSFDMVVHSCQLGLACAALLCFAARCVDTFCADCRQLKAAIKVNCRQTQEAAQLKAIN